MNKRKLQELISKLVKEYTGTGASGGNAGDGNNITSPRPFSNDIEELKNYMYKSIYGGDGNHYRKDSDPFNYNRLKMGLMEQAYGSATLTTQGQYRAPGIMENRAQELADSYSVEELNDQLKQLYRDMEQEAEPEGGPIADQYADEIYQHEEAIRIAKGIGGRGKSSQDKSYTEVALSKLAGPNDAKEYDNEKHRLTIYPGLGSLQYKSRSTQEIVFTHVEGKPAFIRAFGYKRSYDELKKVLSELPEMGDSSFAGFMNVIPDKPIPMENKTAVEMIKAMVRGRDAESKAQSDFYSSRGPTSGTIDEEMTDQEEKKLKKIEKELNKASKLHKAQSVALKKSSKAHKSQADRINKIVKEQATDPAQKAYEIGLKRLQKGVIQFQLKYIEKQRSKALAQAATAGQEASKGFDEQIKALKDQIKAIDNPPKQEKNESLLENYINSRKNSNLMIHMDLYKQTALLEGTMKKIFDKFDNGKTNEDVLKDYAKKGITMPEQFLMKARKHYENFKKQKLEIGFMEQEAKDIVTIPTKVPNLATFDFGGDEKQLASGIKNK